MKKVLRVRNAMSFEPEWFGDVIQSILGRGPVLINLSADVTSIGAGSAGCFEWVDASYAPSTRRGFGT